MTDKIENIVGTGSIELNEKLILNKLADKFDNAKFDPNKFPPLVIKLENPKSTILIFSTGKMVLTGLKTESDVQLAFNIVLKNLTT
ncbi:MAG: hypothetical protein ACFFA4_00505 [Promethearchaeota archaeon]